MIKQNEAYNGRIIKQNVINIKYNEQQNSRIVITK